MYYGMVNPILTILFDLFLVGSAIAIIAAMTQEYFDSRGASIGGNRSASAAPRERQGTALPTSQIRRRQLKRVA